MLNGEYLNHDPWNYLGYILPFGAPMDWDDLSPEQMRMVEAEQEQIRRWKLRVKDKSLLAYPHS